MSTLLRSKELWIFAGKKHY